MEFPSREDWLKNVINPRDRAGGNSLACFEDPSWHEAYYNKFRIARALKIDSVLEIGVRYGYAAHAFLVAGATFYVGLDSDNPLHNSMGEPTCAWAIDMLNRTVPNRNLSIVKTDTQTDPLPVSGHVDFIHIDANHTYQGALGDMQKAWPLCKRAMLVDDYYASCSVRDAVDRFAIESKALFIASPSGTGEALFLR